MSLVLSITWEEVLKRRQAGENLVLLDVRDLDEVLASGTPASAKHMPLYRIEELAGIVLPDMSATIVAFCESGKRSLQAVHFLRKRGYEQSYSLEGGFRQEMIDDDVIS